MYMPRHFAQDDPAVIRSLIARCAVADLVTFNGRALVSSVLPMLVDGPAAGPLEGCALIGHLAKANPQWHSIDPSVDALAIFRGPDAYVTPRWYPSKAVDGRVAPTWNYAVVHVSGPLVLHHDHDWKHRLVERLTDTYEAGAPLPWRVTDAPEDYRASMLSAVVGVELRISRVEAKWKMSQNQPAGNAAGAAEGLRRSGAEGVADLVDVALEARGDR